jgi:sugar phosphate isomerase/epimerase
MPYAGTILWQEFIDAMRHIGYRGDLSFETFAQTRQKKLPVALLPSFLSTIYQTGAYFRAEITKD